MSREYTFFDMLGDMLFNGNKVSVNKRSNEDKEYSHSRGEYSSHSIPSSRSREFDPSDSAGEAFRSVFGDDS